MKVSITTLLIFTAMVALQIRFLQLRWVGVFISLLCILFAFASMMISAFTSESKDGCLAIQTNSFFQFWKTVLLLGLLNLLILLVCLG